MASKLKQRLVGVLLIVLGVGFTVNEWINAATEGVYHPKVAFLFPCFAVLGFAPLLFPMTKEDLLAKFGVEKPSSLGHYSMGQKIIFVLAIAAGALDWALLSGTLKL